MKTSEKLLEKIRRNCPEVTMPQNPKSAQLVRTYGGDKFSSRNRIVFKWANWGTASCHVFSFNTMTGCLKYPIKATWHNEQSFHG